MFQLIGNDPDDILSTFHSQLHVVLNPIISAAGKNPHAYNLRGVDEYYFICNELPSIRKQVSVDDKVESYLILLASHFKTDIELKSRQKTEIKKELQDIRDMVKTCTEETFRLVDADHCLITQQAFRTLWLKRPKRRLCILLKDFVEDIRHQLTNESIHTKEVSRALKTLIAVLNNNTPMLATDTISEFLIAKATRAVPEGEKSLLNAIHMIEPCIIAPSLATKSQQVCIYTI